MDSAPGQEERKLCQENRSYEGQLADWAIAHKRGRRVEELDEASMNQWHVRQHLI